MNWTLPNALAWCGLWLVASNGAAGERKIDFSRDIRPILSDTCFKCHGPDEAERKGGLRLDTREGAMGKLESGAVAVHPGKLDASALISRILATDSDAQMPPPASGKKLTAEQIQLLRRWVESGAEWKEHWSFIRPTRPNPPAVKNEAFVQNPIDRFVLARLEKEGLSPSPPADAVTMIRRVTLDLTGLPPTPAEVDAFVQDSSPAAYDRLVDRLLRSPRYGEHMARYWLDAARYGDTHGLHLDNERSLWPYREWVISAFNKNIPFDRFTVWQLAGDLLPNATTEQRVASGFNRCNVSTSEGGSIDEEVLVRYAVDRVETTSTTWMGLTMGCAVCHDHKFDPVTQKEFYGLFAFFNGVEERAMDGNALSPPPIMKLPTAENQAELAKITSELADARKKIADSLAGVAYVDPGEGAEKKGVEEYVWIDDAVPAGASPQGDAPGWDFVTKPHPVYSGSTATRRKATGLSQHFCMGANPGLQIGTGDKLFAYVYLDPKDPPKQVMLQFNDGTWEHRATWGEDVIPWGAPGSPSRVAMGPLPALGQWIRLEVDAARVGLKPGAVLNGWAFTQHGGTVYWDKSGSVTDTPQAGRAFESLAAWDRYARKQESIKLPQPVLDAVKVEPAKRNDAQKKLIQNHFIEYVCGKTRPTFAPLHQKIDSLQKRESEIDGAVPRTMVMADMPQSRDTFVLIRGAYDKKGNKVSAGVPAALPPLPKGVPVNRLGLAQWLVDPNHPLTARVTVNRFWQQYFGQGLVKTSEDFGAQGRWPTHPELLDWLATDFVISDWDVQRMQKLIVTSGTYRQSSKVTPELAQRDPENELLARGPRLRLDAEMIRDGSLAVSGLLVERIGGRSVKPYQPEGLWETIGFVGSNTSAYKRDAGEGLYRRSLYTFWKRTAPPPSMSTFDAPSRENCTVRRPRTNTPLQALALMNDEQYVEAARNLAQRMMRDGGSTPADRLTHGFRLAVARTPRVDELEVLARLQADFSVVYAKDKAAADKLVGIGESKRDEKLDPRELAAWTMTANMIMNLDEAITKE